MGMSNSRKKSSTERAIGAAADPYTEESQVRCTLTGHAVWGTYTHTTSVKTHLFSEILEHKPNKR